MEIIWNALYDNGFMPHGYCLLWDPWLFWTHAVSDAVIAVSYFSIPAALIFFALRRTDFVYGWILYLFGAFIVCCGLTHVFDIWTLWVPSYSIEGAIKVFTAIVSLATAVLLWPLLPKVIALPSTADLRKSNQELEREVSRRLRAQEELQALYDDLERRVAGRTAELRDRNAQLALATDRANEANEAKSRFLSMMSHELRTPLHGIMSMAELLTETKLDRNQTEYTQTVIRSCQSLISIVDDILDFAKADAGRLSLTTEVIDPSALCEDVVASMAPIAHSRKLDIVTMRFDKSVPNVLTDGTRLRQILTNLVGNAVRYTDVGTITVSSSVRVRESGSTLVLSVQDTGIGIPPEKLESIFERFTQVSEDDLDNARGGAGLGLAISKRLVEMMDGSIVAKSVVGEGSTFIVTLPIEPAAGEHELPEGPGRVAIVGTQGVTPRALVEVLSVSGSIVERFALPEASTEAALPEAPITLLVADILSGLPDLGRFAGYKGRLIVLAPVGGNLKDLSDLDIPDGMALELRHYPIRTTDLFNVLLERPTGEVQGEEAHPEGVARVLVVDDNEENRLVATSVLTRAGHHVSVAETGQAALDLLRSEDFDLVLMDLRMPDLDGFATARAIRSDCPKNKDVPIIAVSANVMPQVVQKCLDAGMNGQLAKPFRPAALREVVAKHARIAEAVGGLTEGEKSQMVLDREYLDEVADSAGPELLLRTINNFELKAEDRARAIKEASSMAELADAAHSLAGGAATVGLPQLTAFCREIENAAIRDDQMGADAGRAGLPAILQFARAALNGYRELKFAGASQPSGPV